MTMLLNQPVTEDATGATWVAICPVDDLLPGRGVAALVGATQVAVFRLGDGSVHAIGNRDPFSEANVLSRGITGSIGGVPVVTSPVYKQRFDLTSGTCLDDPEVSVPTYRSQVDGGVVHIRST